MQELFLFWKIHKDSVVYSFAISYSYNNDCKVVIFLWKCSSWWFFGFIIIFLLIAINILCLGSCATSCKLLHLILHNLQHLQGWFCLSWVANLNLYIFHKMSCGRNFLLSWKVSVIPCVSWNRKASWYCSTRYSNQKSLKQ